MPQGIEFMVESLRTRIDALSEKLVELASREIKKSQAESVAFALGSASNTFRFGDSHNLLAKSGANMDMNSCPLCGIPDADDAFCACLTVMEKSEKNLIGKIKEVNVGDGSGDLENLKKELAVPVKEAPAAPALNPVNPMAAKHTAWGALPHHEKLARVQSLLQSPNAQGDGFMAAHLRNTANAWMQRFGKQPAAAGQVHAPGAAAPTPVVGPKVSSIPGLGKKEMKLEKGAMPGTMKGDMAQASFNASTKPTTPVKPQMPSMADNAARADMLADFTPPGKFDMPKPNPMGMPRGLPGAKMVGPAPTTPKLPGTDIKQPPKVKQNAGGDVVSPNPAPAAPGLGSMKLMRSEDLKQFEEFKKSEDFDYGTCALCGKNEHIGNCQ